MNRPPRFVYGFTLLEMTIAIALGSLIVYVATAGFRTASQTVTAANRLSLENSLLRAGYFEAQNQLDFWTNLDDPTKPDAERPLRQTGKNTNLYDDPTQGLPFTPMKTIWKNTNGLAVSTPRTPATQDGHNEIVPRLKKNGDIPQDSVTSPSVTAWAWEKDNCWDPYFAWAPHDPRTWCRVNMAEKNRPRHNPNNQGWIPCHPRNTIPHYIFGRYAIFSQADDVVSGTLNPMDIQLDFSAAALLNPWPNPIKVTYSGFPTEGIHTWQGRQVRSLLNCMGYSALTEYLPPNAIYAFHRYTGGNSNEGSLACIGVQPKEGWNEYWFSNTDGTQLNARGIYRQTYSTSFGYINPRTYDNLGQGDKDKTSVVGLNKLLEWHYRFFTTDYGAYDVDSNPNTWQNSDTMKWFIDHTAYPEKMLDVKPDNWPQVDVTVGRWVKNARHVALAKVQRFSPLTGEVIELSWTGLGTSLRGARMQRHQSTGWAVWDNNRTGSNTIDPTLDSP